MALSLVEGPVVEPVTLADAKLQIKRGNISEEDTTINGLRQSVRERGERETERAFITQTWDQWLDVFPCDRFIEIAKPPLQTVTYVKYYDLNGTLQTLDADTVYHVSAPAGPRCRRGRVALRSGQSWPSTQDRIDAVVVRFICGYGTGPEHVPAQLKGAMLMDLAALYMDRANEIAEGSRVHKVYFSHKSFPTQRRAA